QPPQAMHGRDTYALELQTMKVVLWVVLLGICLVACSGASSGIPHGASPTAPALGPGALDASFAAMNSPLILAAAMRYPMKTVVEDQPLSLTASDGTGLKLTSLDARAIVDGPLAFTELRLRFENPQDRILEGRFAITLPPDAA